MANLMHTWAIGPVAVSLLLAEMGMGAGGCDPPVECPPEATLEGEPVCHEDYDDHFNGGCGSDPVVYSTISCGGMVCGEGGDFLYGGFMTRDTDWYELELPQPATLSWIGRSEMPLLLVILDAGGGCEDMHVIAFANSIPCQTATATVEVEAGPYWLWIGTSVFEGIPCGTRYLVEAQCEFSAPCPADLDLDGSVGFSDLITLLGAWHDTGVPADVDGSGLVDFADLLLLLAAWGIC